MLRRWQLRPDGDGFATPGSELLPVRLPDGTAAMLKVARDRDERTGAALMQWWNGDGAARVFGLEGDALLMERAQGPGSLLAMAQQGQDDAASRIACGVVARLHAQARPSVVGGCQPLDALGEDAHDRAVGQAVGGI